MEDNMNAPAAQDYSKLYTPLAIIIAGLAVASGLYFGLAHSSGGGAANPGAQPQADVNIKDVKISGAPFIGNQNAPVVMAVWEDYQCPFCKQFETAVLPSLVKKYVDTGKLKIVFKDFQFLGPDSTMDGEWARAVWDLYPAQFAAWRVAIFAQQPQVNSLSESQNAAHLAKVTATVSGINVAKIKAQVVAKKEAYNAAMSADMTEGQGFGVNGTPGFIVGKTLISGAQPLASFTAAIDALLK